jgi:hypothetical protein
VKGGISVPQGFDFKPGDIVTVPTVFGRLHGVIYATSYTNGNGVVFWPVDVHWRIPKWEGNEYEFQSESDFYPDWTIRPVKQPSRIKDKRLLSKLMEIRNSIPKEAPHATA